MTHETLRMLASGVLMTLIYAAGFVLATGIAGGPVFRPAFAGLVSPVRRPHRSAARHRAPGTAVRVHVFGGAHRAR